jgi:hypothetical protein
LLPLDLIGTMLFSSAGTFLFVHRVLSFSAVPHHENHYFLVHRRKGFHNRVFMNLCPSRLEKFFDEDEP